MVRWPAGALVSGLDWQRDLAPLDFAGQLDLVADRIRPYWHRPAILAGRSSGAWLLLNSLLEAGAVYPGTAVCIASALGYGRSGHVGFIAPRAGRFWAAAKQAAISPARELILVHAEDDEQCQIDLARALCARWRGRLVTYSSGGHGLGKSSPVEW